MVKNDIILYYVIRVEDDIDDDGKLVGENATFISGPYGWHGDAQSEVNQLTDTNFGDCYYDVAAQVITVAR